MWVTGGAWAPVEEILPMLNGGVSRVIGVFLALTFVWLLMVYIITSLVVGVRRRKAITA